MRTPVPKPRAKTPVTKTPVTKTPVTKPLRSSKAADLTPAQKAAVTRAKNKEKKDKLNSKTAKRMAQIVNLHIAGYSLAEIGASIGCSADDVDRMLAQDAARYVRNQPALRTYVRNYVSSKYSQLLESVWDGATATGSPEQLDNYDRALRTLERMAKLHGAEAPIQKEIVVDAAPEAVSRLVDVLAASQGFGYDTSVFDTVDPDVADIIEAEIVEDPAGNPAENPAENTKNLAHEFAVSAAEALEVSGNLIDEPELDEPELDEPELDEPELEDTDEED